MDGHREAKGTQEIGLQTETGLTLWGGGCRVGLMGDRRPGLADKCHDDRHQMLDSANKILPI